MKTFKSTHSGQMMVRGFVLLGAIAGMLGLRTTLAFSQTFPDRVSYLVKTFISVITALVAGMTNPVIHMSVQSMPVPAVRSHWLTGTKASTLTLVSGEQSDVHRFTYTFKGQAMHEGKPCGLASIMIRVDSPNGQETKQVTADTEGRYTIPFHVYAKKYEPIRWSMQARADHSQYVRLAGQRICMTEEKDVTLDGVFELAQLYSDNDIPNPVMHVSNHSEDLE